MDSEGHSVPKGGSKGHAVCRVTDSRSTQKQSEIMKNPVRLSPVNGVHIKGVLFDDPSEESEPHKTRN